VGIRERASSLCKRQQGTDLPRGTKVHLAGKGVRVWHHECPALSWLVDLKSRRDADRLEGDRNKIRRFGKNILEWTVSPNLGRIWSKTMLPDLLVKEKIFGMAIVLHVYPLILNEEWLKKISLILRTKFWAKWSPVLRGNASNSLFVFIYLFVDLLFNSSLLKI
jgi:hypothetical protein